MAEISFYNRYTGKIEKENVYGGKWVSAAYRNAWTLRIVDRLLASPVASRIYGSIQNHNFSRRKIDGFIKNFQIPMEEFEPGPFKSFNDFFKRAFRQGQRPFDPDSRHLAAPAEGRYYGFKEIGAMSTFPVKGVRVDLPKILGPDYSQNLFSGGPLLISRLCPVDYHRFHFPDDSKILKSYKLHGKFHSVNPRALKIKNDIFFTNERVVTILETQNFGKMAYVEVGALGVGKIVQSFHSYSAQRGDEKGYFLFGGSTIILIGQKNSWVPSSDILSKTALGIETYVKLGDVVGTKA